MTVANASALVKSGSTVFIATLAGPTSLATYTAPVAMEIAVLLGANFNGTSGGALYINGAVIGLATANTAMPSNTVNFYLGAGQSFTYQVQGSTALNALISGRAI